MRCPTLHEIPPAHRATPGWPRTGGARPAPETLCDGRPWPRISIVTPSLNQGAFVEESIRSVLLQAYPNLELIVIDGGSTDGSVDTIKRYAAWLAHWICEGDAGPANALNKGFRLASGEILGFLNADDFLLPGCLERVANEFRMHEWADVVSGHGFMAKASGELGARICSDRWDSTRFAHGACVLVQAATFFRRRALQRVHGFNETNHTAWDAQLWADMALAGASFHSIDEPLAVYRVHPASISGSSRLRKQRLHDIGAVLGKMRGRRETAPDRLYSLWYRFRKFSGHPGRTLQQRWFFYSILGRWSL